MSESHHPIFNPQKRGLIDGAFSQDEVRLANRNPGTLLETLRHDVTPLGLHYLLIHFDVPFVRSASDWTLNVLVERPVTYSLEELKRFAERTLRVTFECAGNGRAGITPRAQSQPWHHEAVGTADWTGTSLKAILERAGVATDARDIVFYGKDRGFSGGVEHDYGRSLTPKQALGASPDQARPTSSTRPCSTNRCRGTRTDVSGNR